MLGIGGRNPWDYYKYIIKCFHSEKELIEYLAHGYYFLLDNNEKIYYNRRYDYSYYDNYNRVINPRWYEDDAWEYYQNFIMGKEYQYMWEKNNKYHTPSRGKTIPYTRKIRGGPNVRPRKHKHFALIYDNPEYRGFNRGSRSEFPQGWWDDFYRHTEKNWKRQSKRRHQWKER